MVILALFFSLAPNHAHVLSYIRKDPTAFYVDGEGDPPGAVMVYPTESTFVLPAMVPGETVIDFCPEREGERLQKILCRAEDISKTGLVTKAGERSMMLTAQSMA